MPLFNYLPSKLPPQFPSSLPTGFFPLPLSTLKPLTAVKEKFDAVPSTNTSINGLSRGRVKSVKKSSNTSRYRKTNIRARKTSSVSRKPAGVRKAKAPASNGGMVKKNSTSSRRKKTFVRKVVSRFTRAIGGPKRNKTNGRFS